MPNFSYDTTPSSLPAGTPVSGGPGMPGGLKLLQIWRQLWIRFHWWIIGVSAVVVLGGVAAVLLLHRNSPPGASPVGTSQSQQQGPKTTVGQSTTPQSKPGETTKPTTNTPTNDKKTTPATGSSGGQSGGTSGNTQNTGGGGTGGTTTSCSGTAGTPGGTDSWGGCWPGSSNTGVPSGTTLQRVPQDITSGSGWSWNSTDQVIYVTGSNATLSGLNVSGGIIATVAGVTIKNTKASGIGMSGAARNTANPRLTIQDSEIDCGNQLGSTAIGDINLTVVRVNIHGCENGFDTDSDTSITDSYIHDLFNSTVGDPHTDGLQSAVGSNLTITHNVFYGFTTGCVYPNNGSCNGTSAINVNNNSSGPTSSNTTISKNLLAGGAYTLYCPVPATVNFKVMDNHFSRVYSPNVGEFGPSSDCVGETQSGNVIHETGAAVTLD
ncbi:MAG TPA: right-handed parallel beta-helix repeat-containing protein [Patescibacteria group bacterium]|nr:right-handed parallel beta-helix repeat-containing protein [Patescibacteria group bacterium]